MPPAAGPGDDGYQADVPLELPDALPLYVRLQAVGDTVFAVEHSRWSTPEGREPQEPDRRILRLFSIHGVPLGEIHVPAAYEPLTLRPGEVWSLVVEDDGRSYIDRYLFDFPGTP